jgi:hypothetical protein
VNGDARLAGNFALWVTRDRLAIWVRDAGASRFLDPGDTGDISILSGIHPRTVSHVDFVAGVGLGWSLGHDDAGRELQRTPVLALGTQLNVNYRVIGLVLDGFAAAGNSRSYYGVCLGVGVGWFR